MKYKKFGFIARKGGVGKTTNTLNTCLFSSKMNPDTEHFLVDADHEAHLTANLHLHGYEEFIDKTLKFNPEEIDNKVEKKEKWQTISEEIKKQYVDLLNKEEEAKAKSSLAGILMATNDTIQNYQSMKITENVDLLSGDASLNEDAVRDIREARLSKIFRLFEGHVFMDLSPSKPILMKKLMSNCDKIIIPIKSDDSDSKEGAILTMADINELNSDFEELETRKPIQMAFAFNIWEKKRSTTKIYNELHDSYPDIPKFFLRKNAVVEYCKFTKRNITSVSHKTLSKYERDNAELLEWMMED